ncbi:hypothetical protein AB6A40_005666 [Gnathostoma spinigerum]|uniref:Secreted protein n=1 Tax=Gnathostoma spinigerum TaxID=75299 RepID=A0ABD6EIB1_9BILA
MCGSQTRLSIYCLVFSINSLEAFCNNYRYHFYAMNNIKEKMAVLFFPVKIFLKNSHSSAPYWPSNPLWHPSSSASLFIFPPAKKHLIPTTDMKKVHVDHCGIFTLERTSFTSHRSLFRYAFTN